ncbi:hypothetical protein AB0I81_31910 [Nonomuraea sp. NPDC050404]|uniref:hypothetical protein n=1 Tax=Nonomuraea sp. NPDC050404 TaxID=3155783 RepID=UPI0033E8436A
MSAVASCGTEVARPPEPIRYTASIPVLEGDGHGPQLCPVLMTSDPPQCHGPDVLGWDWSKVEHESERGVKWGTYRVTGTWDGARLTLTEPPGEPDERKPPKEDGLGLDTPCPAPEGGWRVLDPARTTEKTMNRALERARTADDFAGAWLDRLAPMPPHPEEQMEVDAESYVINLRFTGDLAEREGWIREVWGGALCITAGQRTEAEMLAIQRRLEGVKDAGIVSTSANPITGKVVIGVWVADDGVRGRLEGEYGADAITVEGRLQPVG